jgi:hypothetical protein
MIQGDLWLMARMSAVYGNNNQCSDIGNMFGED